MLCPFPKDAEPFVFVADEVGKSVVRRAVPNLFHLDDFGLRRGHQSGSWYFDHDWSSRGGRLYDTALSILTLEVYYRHLPLYRDSAVQDDFQAAK